MRDPGPSPDRIARYRRGRLSEWVAAAALLAQGLPHPGAARAHAPRRDRPDRRARTAARLRRGQAPGDARRRPRLPLTTRQAGRIARAAEFWVSRHAAFREHEPRPRRHAGRAAAACRSTCPMPCRDAGDAALNLALTLSARNSLQIAAGRGAVAAALAPQAALEDQDRMPLNVACQMDPIDRIDIQRQFDLRPAARGAAARPQALLLHAAQSLAAGRPPDRARLHARRSRTRPAPTIACPSRAPRTWPTCDVVLLRQDPPFDMSYITTTHLLERIHPKTLVVNDPANVRNAPEKVFVLDFLDLMPPTLVTRNLEDVKAFRAEHKDIILKPLYGNGGSSVFRIAAGRHQPQLAGRAVPDRVPRALHGAAVPPRGARRRQAHHPGRRRGGRRRQPRAGSRRDALQPARRRHRHGRPSSPPRDREICARLGPELKKRGLLFTGIDVIGPYLTEINVTSPTGIRQVKAFGGADIAALIWDAIERKVKR